MKDYIRKITAITVSSLFILSACFLLNLVAQDGPSPSDPCFAEKVTLIQRQNQLKDAKKALDDLLAEGAFGYVEAITQRAAVFGWGSAFGAGFGGLVGGGPGGAAIGFGTGLFTGSIIGGIHGFFERKKEIREAREAVETAEQNLEEAEAALESCKARNPNHIHYD